MQIFMTFCISKIVRTGKCFGFKGRQILLTGNSIFCGFGGWEGGEGGSHQLVTSFWKEVHEELNDLHSSPNIVRVIKSRRMRWAGHVARIGEEGGV